ncbi:DUF1617 family protein [Sutcliffiella horikoshii]|uniref:DUF1617 family protein n=1 Tax=Sutcliffiella horikoshii TaxID=79883 RepID=UPI003CF0790D
MKIAIENGKLGQAIDLLFNLSLIGKQSRHRTSLILIMNERLKEVEVQEKELLKEHCYLDEAGEPKKKDNDQYWDIKDIETFVQDKKELMEEELVIEGGDHHGMLKTVKSILLDCDVEFSRQQAVIYDYLCELFEGGDE